MVSARKRIKLFNRTLQEFAKGCKDIVRMENITDKSGFYDIEFLNTFNKEVNLVKKEFLNCNIECLESITICKKLSLYSGMKEITSVENKKCVWKYLHNMFLMTIEDLTKEEDLLENSRKGLDNLKETAMVVAQPSPTTTPSMPFKMDGDMGSLIEEVSKNLSQKLEGKDLSNINPMDLMASLTGNSTEGSLGIDFSSILKDVTETIQSKVNNGELNLENLKNQAKTMINNNPNFKHNEEISKVLDLD